MKRNESITENVAPFSTGEQQYWKFQTNSCEQVKLFSCRIPVEIISFHKCESGIVLPSKHSNFDEKVFIYWTETSVWVKNSFQMAFKVFFPIKRNVSQCGTCWGKYISATHSTYRSSHCGSLRFHRPLERKGSQFPRVSLASLPGRWCIAS